MFFFLLKRSKNLRLSESDPTFMFASEVNITNENSKQQILKTQSWYHIKVQTDPIAQALWLSKESVSLQTFGIKKEKKKNRHFMAANMAVRFNTTVPSMHCSISAVSLQTLVVHQEPANRFRKAQQLGLLGLQPRPGWNRLKSFWRPLQEDPHQTSGAEKRWKHLLHR